MWMQKMGVGDDGEYLTMLEFKEDDSEDEESGEEDTNDGDKVSGLAKTVLDSLHKGLSKLEHDWGICAWICSLISASGCKGGR